MLMLGWHTCSSWRDTGALFLLARQQQLVLEVSMNSQAALVALGCTFAIFLPHVCA